MGKMWILVLLFVAVGYAMQLEYDSNESQDDYEYDNWYKDFSNLAGEFVDLPDDNDKEIFEKIQENDNNDYQIEDNRSALEENNEKQENHDNGVGKDEINNENLELSNVAESSFEEEMEAEDEKESFDLENDDAVIKLEQLDENNNKNDQGDDLPDGNNENSAEISFDVNSDIESLPLPPKADINEELKKSLIEDENDEEINDFGDMSDEDSVDKAYKDLNDDLNKLMETWKKLSTDENEEEKDPDDSIRPDDILEYEEKYGRPYKEAVILSQRDDYADADEKNEEDPDSPVKEIKVSSTIQIDSKIQATADEDADVVLKNEEKYKEIVSAEKNNKNPEDNVDNKNDEYINNNDEAQNKLADNNDKKVDNVENEDNSNTKQLESEILRTAAENNDEDVILGKEENEDSIVSAERDVLVFAEDVDDGDADNEKETDDDDDLEEIDDDSILDNAKNSNNNGFESIEPINSILDIDNNNVKLNSLNDKADKADDDKVQNDVEEVQNDKNAEMQPRKYLADAISSYEPPFEPEQRETSTEKETQTIDVTDISPEQYNKVMEQFKTLHKDELGWNPDTFDTNVAVIHIPISLDESVVVESPNYPSPYPVNNIIDWMFEGDGMGIEFNITDLAVNGVGGDYLLVKPGGIDESGTDGLVFSYHLNEPRRYRFLDVDRMFVRFVAQPGWSFPSLRGFQFSVKLVAPSPMIDEEPLPDPEPELPEPVETLTLVLGGIPAPQFARIQEEFRRLVADMATLYINSNGIDAGVNTTLEVTQITSVAICNINWPDFKNCTQVTFAVPLVYEEYAEDDEPRLSNQELSSMWSRYNGIDPFASRLRRMGITEFAGPNDSSVLAVWLVVSAGALVIMAIMAIALWRYSCFENYTRMPEFSSQDSIYNEKQGLDLYPTPHQTLPPLYESEFNWPEGKFDDSTRVDMGGYTNRNFTRDELSDIESDEEVISTRDTRKAVVTPKDGYEA